MADRARPDRDMTTGEAEAFRQGWEAAKARAVSLAKTLTEEFTTNARPDLALGAACVGNAIRAMEAPHD